MTNENSNKKRRLKKGKLVQFIFCICSLLLFLFCVIFYGLRLIKYYKIYNPKSESGESVDLLATRITKDASVVYDGDGLYRINGTYLFKGEVENNYLTYAGMTWRIVKIGADNSVEIVLDEPINNLMWNKTITEYKNSDVHKYLNDVFLKTLNKDLLVPSNICTDTVTDITKITCTTTEKEYFVKLMSVTDYLNTKVKKTFVNTKEDSLWLSDRNKTKAWYASGTHISSYDPKESFLVKPVVTLNAQNTVLGGKGTKESPYQIEKEKKNIKPGSYVKLGTDTYIAYEVNKDNVKLILDGLYKEGATKYRFDRTSNVFSVTKEGSLGYYLNTTFYNSLAYKNLLVEASWYTGSYKTSYKDINESKVMAKVGLYNIADLKFGLVDTDSYLLTPGLTGTTYTLGRKMGTSKITNTEAIRPAIAISVPKIKTGNGTSSSPYELEG
ncbi:MAG: hypothetical protein PHN72_02925 [Bacilli bacterium]|nr:hypothetical protein [Bacilli bacterium]